MFVNVNKFCGCWSRKFWSIRKALPFATPSRSLKQKTAPLRAERQRPNPFLLVRLNQVIFCVRGVFAPFRGSQTPRGKNNTKRIPVHLCLLLSRPTAH